MISLRCQIYFRTLCNVKKINLDYGQHENETKIQRTLLIEWRWFTNPVCLQCCEQEGRQCAHNHKMDSRDVLRCMMLALAFFALCTFAAVQQEEKLASAKDFRAAMASVKPKPDLQQFKTTKSNSPAPRTKDQEKRRDSPNASIKKRKASDFTELSSILLCMLPICFCT